MSDKSYHDSTMILKVPLIDFLFKQTVVICAGHTITSWDIDKLSKHHDCLCRNSLVIIMVYESPCKPCWMPYHHQSNQ